MHTKKIEFPRGIEREDVTLQELEWYHHEVVVGVSVTVQTKNFFVCRWISSIKGGVKRRVCVCVCTPDFTRIPTNAGMAFSLSDQKQEEEDEFQDKLNFTIILLVVAAGGILHVCSINLLHFFSRGLGA